MRITFSRTLLFLAIALTDCAIAKVKTPELPQEIVLRAGMQIRFRNANGSGVWSYVSPFQRKFTFGGYSQTIKMIARPERFLGTLGLYEPAERGFWSMDRGPRIVAIEAERHFRSIDEAKAALIESSAVLKWVYNREGYVVGFGQNPSRNQANITIYRYFINGRPARLMAGYNDRSVIVTDTSSGF